jgi:hypothetical protein
MRRNAHSFRSRKSKWRGIDVDLARSLFEYGMVAVQKPDRDHPDEWFVVHQIGKNRFGTSFAREKDLDDLIDGKEWASQTDIQSFLSTMGMSKSQWKQNSFVSKLSDLISYWGEENILGTEYYPITIKQLLRLSENFAKEYGEDYRL